LSSPGATPTAARGTWFDLDGRVALVTGAGKGLGRTIAGALARAGADIVAVSRTPADLEAVAAEIAALGRRSVRIVADVGDEGAVQAMVEQALAGLGRIDILVNNAGIEGVAPALEIEVADWDRVMAVNLRGPMLCCKHVGPHMIARRCGKVINVASVLASQAQRKMGPYAPSKAGLVQYTKVVALEWLPHNIQVNALCPGYFVTPMNRDFLESPAGIRFLERLPAKRAGHADEIAGAAVFLASDATSYITGTALYVDGGHSLR